MDTLSITGTAGHVCASCVRTPKMRSNSEANNHPHYTSLQCNIVINIVVIICFSEVCSRNQAPLFVAFWSAIYAYFLTISASKSLCVFCDNNQPQYTSLQCDIVINVAVLIWRQRNAQLFN